jgi:hypothetical protein
MIIHLPRFLIEWYDVVCGCLLQDATSSPNTTLSDVSPLHTHERAHNLLTNLVDVILLKGVRLGFPHYPRVYPSQSVTPRVRLVDVYKHATIYLGAAKGLPLHKDEPKLVKGRVTNTSILVYMGSEFTGGSLHFPDLKVTLTLRPRDVVIFPHSALHISDAVTSGAKSFVRISASLEWGWSQGG